MPLKIRVAVRLGERYHTRMINLITFVALTLGAQDTTLSVIPRPLHMTRGTGEFAFTSGTVIVTDRVHARHRVSASRLVAAGDWLSVVGRSARLVRRQVVSLRLDPALARGWARRGYRLSVTPTRIVIRAFRPAGAFLCRADHAPAAAPRQLFRQALRAGLTWSVPVVEIEDMPRFPWRGAHLDVSRSFMPKEFVKKYIDCSPPQAEPLPLAFDRRSGLADRDQEVSAAHVGRRVAAQLARRRATQLRGHHPIGSTTTLPHGGFYTQDDVREVVAYAQGRFITVVPEIEMPGPRPGRDRRLPLARQHRPAARSPGALGRRRETS